MKWCAVGAACGVARLLPSAVITISLIDEYSKIDAQIRRAAVLEPPGGAANH